ncbi:hypothetical protein Mal4_51330 [Maioricimonas rarisocia]|uniref:Uncharacterized protein n=1 Tax=Maioricimonas rarisocia TaxID=2528026 RepID=A0A517ZE59_9PLAN|nr:hypothetical protein Mal4_51330 [Maioricimonas rarisocia]
MDMRPLMRSPTIKWALTTAGTDWMDAPIL